MKRVIPATSYAVCKDSQHPLILQFEVFIVPIIISAKTTWIYNLNLTLLSVLGYTMKSSLEITGVTVLSVITPCFCIRWIIIALYWNVFTL